MSGKSEDKEQGLIANRYRVERKINKSERGTTYLVSDTKNNNEQSVLLIIIIIILYCSLYFNQYFIVIKKMPENHRVFKHQQHGHKRNHTGGEHSVQDWQSLHSQILWELPSQWNHLCCHWVLSRRQFCYNCFIQFNRIHSNWLSNWRAAIWVKK